MQTVLTHACDQFNKIITTMYNNTRYNSLSLINLINKLLTYFYMYTYMYTQYINITTSVQSLYHTHVHCKLITLYTYLTPLVLTSIQ